MKKEQSVETQVSFYSSGSRLHGRFSAPGGVDGTRPVVVLATGDGTSGSRSSTWSGFRAALDRAGIASFLFDFQGLGESDGPTRELTLSVGLDNMRDAVARVREEDWVDADRVAILGSSFGGNVALLYAAQDPRIVALALKSPVSFYPETHEASFGVDGMAAWKASGYHEGYGYDYSFYLDSLDHNTYAEAKKVHCPVMIVHGDADRDVPIVQSRRLMECLTQADLVVLAGVEHDYAQGNSREVMTARITEWLTSKLN